MDGNIIAIIGIVLATIIGSIGCYYTYKTFKKTESVETNTLSISKGIIKQMEFTQRVFQYAEHKNDIINGIKEVIHFLNKDNIDNEIRFKASSAYIRLIERIKIHIIENDALDINGKMYKSISNYYNELKDKDNELFTIERQTISKNLMRLEAQISSLGLIEFKKGED